MCFSHTNLIAVLASYLLHINLYKGEMKLSNPLIFSIERLYEYQLRQVEKKDTKRVFSAKVWDLHALQFWTVSRGEFYIVEFC